MSLPSKEGRQLLTSLLAAGVSHLPLCFHWTPTAIGLVRTDGSSQISWRRTEQARIVTARLLPPPAPPPPQSPGGTTIAGECALQAQLLEDLKQEYTIEINSWDRSSQGRFEWHRDRHTLQVSRGETVNLLFDPSHPNQWLGYFPAHHIAALSLQLDLLRRAYRILEPLQHVPPPVFSMILHYLVELVPMHE